VLTLLATAFGLGLIFNAAPGPVFAETVRRGVRGGFRPALAVQLGSLAGDAVWAVVGLAGVGLLGQLEPLRVPIGIAGVGYLFWLAWEAWRESTREFAIEIAGDGAYSREALRSGVLLSMTNPQNVAYWAAMGSAVGAVGVQEPTAVHYVAFFVGFMFSSIVWAFLFAGLVDRVLGGVEVRWARITHRACAVAFFALALASLRELWISLRPDPSASTPSTISREP
jgi:chemosensory pili system protein ChpE